MNKIFETIKDVVTNENFKPAAGAAVATVLGVAMSIGLAVGAKDNFVHVIENASKIYEEVSNSVKTEG